MSKQPTTTEPSAPIVTTGVESSKVPATTAPETPKKSTTAASASGTPESVASKDTDKQKKKKNRLSFFNKLKEKFHHEK